MTSSDSRTAADLARLRDVRVAASAREVLAWSPFWSGRFGSDGARPEIGSVADLARLPTTGEHELCPDGDPAGAARLVLQPDEAGWLAGTPRGGMWRALGRRLVDRDGYRQVVDEDLRPTSYVFGGLTTRFPLASTRGDLDVVARAGARLWRVAGLGADDVLVSALAPAATPAHQALSLAALAAGAPALFPGDGVGDVAATLRLVPATALALPFASAGDLLYELAEAGAPLEGLRVVLLVGAPEPAERAVTRDALDDVGAGGAVALGVHVASGHRLAWAECREGAERGLATGWHTYPDFEVVEVVDAETGGEPPDAGPVEVAVTQLGMRGSALLRWRTGDLAGAPPTDEPCPACGRRVPRLPADLRRAAVTATLATPAGPRTVDLRSVTAVLAGDPDVRDFRLAVDDGRLAVGYLPAPSADVDELRVDLGERLGAAAGVAPATLVPMAPDAADAQYVGAPGQLTRRVVVRDGTRGLG